MVAPACLNLQNEHGLDVNLILFCCWHGAVHGELSSALLEKASNYSISWRENLVQPLRSARIWMKSAKTDDLTASPGYEALRQQIKAVELAAEKMQQSVLQDMVLESGYGGIAANPESAIRGNLKSLLELTNTVATPAVDQSLTILIKASLASSEAP
ncbi:MAG: hypothetical protein ACI95C_000785 [Pseudohongiellaceae bacterium]|jgi:uncharacterized protein (TIGR02444 family)